MFTYRFKLHSFDELGALDKLSLRDSLVLARAQSRMDSHIGSMDVEIDYRIYGGEPATLEYTGSKLDIDILTIRFDNAEVDSNLHHAIVNLILYCGSFGDTLLDHAHGCINCGD